MPKCAECKNDAYYGLVKNILTHCRFHKTNRMIFLRGTMCKNKTCLKQASFGIPGDKVKFCSTHKEKGMVNLRLHKCDKSGCRLRPCYRGSDKTYCFEHKKDRMLCFNSDLGINQEVRWALIKAMIELEK